ncbi:transcriptional adapter 1-like [Neocloeon triangulifer]|uniref:transcriptional adapter 1-like n=1 Tax=Neocloeon triangulifer TaxID=2078957 RepID=UPI00286EC48B|nr:transcriptional adapter 1-like [Neocloeon triangulifer]
MTTEFPESNLIRAKIIEILGDENSNKYFTLLKTWFRMKMSKEDFDFYARKLLPPEAARLHNHFLLSLLNQCQPLAESLRLSSPFTTSSKVFSSPEPPLGPFETVEPAAFVKESRPARAQAAQAPLPLQTPVHSEAHLPDLGLMMGRLLVAGWDHGLQGARYDVALCLVEATRGIVKAVLEAVVRLRGGHRLRDGRFAFGLGSRPPPLLPRQEGPPSKKPRLEEAEQQAAQELAAASPGQENARQPINLFDLYLALKVQPNVIPSTSVHARLVETISAKMQHPSLEEMQALSVVKMQP